MTVVASMPLQIEPVNEQAITVASWVTDQMDDGQQLVVQPEGDQSLWLLLDGDQSSAQQFSLLVDLGGLHKGIEAVADEESLRASMEVS